MTTAAATIPAKPGLKSYLGVLAALLLIPALLILAKNADLPFSDFLANKLSLESLPEKVQKSLGHILFLPLAAIVVVFFRLTLGIRVLGPFRSILLAWAFKYTGVFVGIFFLLLTVSTLVALRQPVKQLKLPYFGRITIMLSGVAAVMVLVLLASTWFETDWTHAITHLPVVVLCLISEAFSTKMTSEGRVAAVWKMFTTVVVAMLITLLANWHAPLEAMIRYPELLFMQIGAIIIVSRFMAFRYFDWLNPGIDTDEADDQIGEKEVKDAAKNSTADLGVKVTRKETLPTAAPALSQVSQT